jgi:uracil permease
VICILLAFVGTIPVFVSGGLALYLFGVNGMQGIALMQEHKVNMFEPLPLALGATIMVIGMSRSRSVSEESEYDMQSYGEWWNGA